MAEQRMQDKAFKLLDEYNKPETSEDRIERIVAQLYKMGYIVRPNPGSAAWGLVDRRTRMLVKRMVK
jgi:hypothetical protein